MRRRALATAVAFAAVAWGQSPIFIDTVAGAGLFDNRPALETPLVQPQAIWVHSNGDIYVSDGNFVVRRIRNNQSVIVAGGGRVVDDSIAVAARDAFFDFPSGLAVTEDGSLYIADVRHHRIRRVTQDGQITTVAGTGVAGYSGDGGPATFAQLRTPGALTVSSTGDVVFAEGTSVIRRYDPRSRTISTIAGTGEFGNTGDSGPARQAKIGSIAALAYDRAGNLYLADNSYFVIRKVAADGRITRIAGTGVKGNSGDGGQALSAEIGNIIGLAVDATGNVFLSDGDYERIRRIDTSGVITTFAGRDRPRNPGAENQLATELTLMTPGGLGFDPQGNLIFAEVDMHIIRRVDASTRSVTTVAGTRSALDDRPAMDSVLTLPSHVAVDPEGNVYVAEHGKMRVRKINSVTGVMTTVAGDGRDASAVDATERSIGRAVSISMGSRNQLWIADRSMGLIRRVDLSSGAMVTVLDLTQFNWERDGVEPSFVVEAADGGLFISEWFNDVVLYYSPQRELFYVAGTEGVTDYTGDGGPSTKATLNGPEGLALDGKGGLLICDSMNRVVRRVDLAELTISTFAGDGLEGADFDGFPATQASMREPSGIAVDNEGYVYITDHRAHQVRLVTPKGIMLTLTGNDTRGFSGDGGPAVLASMDEPLGIALYGGSVLVVDTRNYRLRLIYVKEVSNRLRVGPDKLTFRGAEGGDQPSAQLLTVNSEVVGVKLKYALGGGTYEGGAWLKVDELEGETPNVIVVFAETTGMKTGTYTGVLEVSSQGAASVSIPVELYIEPPDQVKAAKLSTDLIRLTAPKGGTDSSTLRISAAGNQQLEWSVRRLTPSQWLVLSAESGKTPAEVQVTLNTADLAPGNYTAVTYIDIAGGSPTLFVVTANVTEAKPVLLTDRDSFVFETTEGTTSVPEQFLSILNNGSSDLNWQLALPAGLNWLRVSQAEGVVAPGERNSGIRIAASPAGLAAGNYNAVLTVRGGDAIGAPRNISVRLRVQPAGTAARAIFDRTALAFFSAPGAGPQEQLIRLSTTGSGLSFSTTVRTANGGRWLSVAPGEGTLVSASQTYDLRVSVVPSGLSADTYQEVAGCPRPAYCGTLTYTFSDGSMQEIAVLLVLQSGDTTTSESKNRSAGCAPTRQLVLSSSLSNNFAVSAGWPVPMRVRVFDDCGNPLTASSVTASFTNGDPVLPLTNLRNGDYTGTWTPTPGSTKASITMRSLHSGLEAGEWQAGVQISSSGPPAPILLSGGVMNAASKRRASAIAPRSMIVLQGANFPSEAAEATVLIGGETAQVLSSKPDEIRALVPSSIAGQPLTFVMVSAGGFVTAPETVSVVPNDPGLFALPEGTAPAPGGTVTITGTGFGAVDGEGKVTSAVTARIDETEVPVESATIASDGVYQLTIKLPAEMTGEHQLTVLQNGAVSNSIPLNISGTAGEPAQSSEMSSRGTPK